MIILLFKIQQKLDLYQHLPALINYMYILHTYNLSDLGFLTNKQTDRIVTISYLWKKLVFKCYNNTCIIKNLNT